MTEPLDRWGPEVPELLRMLEREGTRLDLREGRVVVKGPASALQNKRLVGLVRERRLDLEAWLNGDKTQGIRRLSGGRIAWKPEPAATVRQEFADRD